MTTSGESEQLLIKYLLNEVSEEERERVEERLFTDRDFVEQVKTAEMRLVDRYVLGQMSADEEVRFVSGYLPSPEHARRVREAQQFHAQLKIFRSAWGDDTGERDPHGDGPFSRAARFGVPAFVALSLLAIGTFVGTSAVLLTLQRDDLVINGNGNQILLVREKLSPPPPASPVPTRAMLTSEHEYTPRPDAQPSPRAGSTAWFTYHPDTIAKVSRIKSLNPVTAYLPESGGRLEATIDFRRRGYYSDPDANFMVTFSGSVRGKEPSGAWLLYVKKHVRTVYIIPDVRVDDGDEVVILRAGRDGCAEGQNSRPVEFKPERIGKRIVRVVLHFDEPSAGSYLFKVREVSRCFNLQIAEE